MIPARSISLSRLALFGWANSNQGTSVLQDEAVQLYIGDNDPVIEQVVRLPVIENGMIYVVIEAEEDGLLKPGDLIMPNGTLEPGEHGEPPFVRVNGIYRAFRATKHAAADDKFWGSRFGKIHAIFGQRILISQATDTGDIAGWAEHEQEMTNLYAEVEDRVGQSDNQSDKDLLYAMKRAGLLFDITGRPNPCALPLVMRMAQRHLDDRAVKLHERAAKTQTQADSIAGIIAMLEMKTNWVAEQVNRMIASPWLNDLFEELTLSEQNTHRKRVANAATLHIPELITTLTPWTLPAPFDGRFQKAKKYLGQAKAELNEYLESLADDRTPNSALQKKIRVTLMYALEPLVELIYNAQLEDFIVTAQAFMASTKAAGTEISKDQMEHLLQTLRQSIHGVARAYEQDFGLWRTQIGKIYTNAKSTDGFLHEVRELELVA